MMADRLPDCMLKAFIKGDKPCRVTRDLRVVMETAPNINTPNSHLESCLSMYNGSTRRMEPWQVGRYSRHITCNSCDGLVDLPGGHILAQVLGVYMEACGRLGMDMDGNKKLDMSRLPKECTGSEDLGMSPCRHHFILPVAY
jgi:hypothetical protein